DSVYFSHLMEKLTGDSKKDSVAKSGVRSLDEQMVGTARFHLQETALVSAWAQVEAQGSAAAFGVIGVPTVVVTGIGGHPVYESSKPCEGTATGDFVHDFQKPRTVGDEMQKDHAG